MADWVKVFSDLPTSYKTTGLMRILSVDRNAAMGIVVNLLLFARRHCPKSGNLEPWGGEGIADACYWKQDPHILVNALRDCGGVDEAGKKRSGFLDAWTIHDWTSRQRDLIGGIEYEERRAIERQERRGQGRFTGAPPQGVSDKEVEAGRKAHALAEKQRAARLAAEAQAKRK